MRLAVLGILLTVGLISCGGGGGKKPAACTAVDTVDTKDAVNFAPKCAQIPTGGTIKWRNTDGVPHTVTFTSGGEFDKYFEKKDETVSRAFATAGTFDYYCKIHGKVMSGKIVVTAS